MQKTKRKGVQWPRIRPRNRIGKFSALKNLTTGSRGNSGKLPLAVENFGKGKMRQFAKRDGLVK